MIKLISQLGSGKILVLLFIIKIWCNFHKNVIELFTRVVGHPSVGAGSLEKVTSTDAPRS